jgi:hypothetical protein
MKDSASTIASGLFYFSMFALSVLGIYHSYDEHDDDGYLIWSPFAIYRGAEFFFHDDTKEWRAELPNVAYFLETMSYNNPPKFNTELAEFKERINDFSEDGKYYLKSFADSLLAYRRAFQEDFKNSILALEWGEEFKFNISSKTTLLREKLEAYGLKNQFDLEDKSMSAIYTDINNKLYTASYDEFEDLKIKVESNDKIQAETYKYAYNEIFK